MINLPKSEEEKILPIVPIRDGVVFPGTEIVLTFGRPRSLAAIEASHASEKFIALVMQKSPQIHEPTPGDLYTIGTLAQIERVLRTENEINALVKGINKVEIVSYKSLDPYYQGKVVEITDEFTPADEVTALTNHIVQLLKKAVNLGKSVDFL